MGSIPKLRYLPNVSTNGKRNDQPHHRSEEVMLLEVMEF